MQDKHEHNGVELEDRAFSEQTKRDVIVCPALGYPVGHEGGD